MPQNLQITPVLNGWIVQAGCQTVVYTDSAKIVAEFCEWLSNPDAIENRYKNLMKQKGLGENLAAAMEERVRHEPTPPPCPPPQTVIGGLYRS